MENKDDVPLMYVIVCINNNLVSAGIVHTDTQPAWSASSPTENEISHIKVKDIMFWLET